MAPLKSPFEDSFIKFDVETVVVLSGSADPILDKWTVFIVLKYSNLCGE
jgi:signal peptidase I